MKKMLALVLAVCMALSFVACGGAASGSGAPVDAGSTPATPAAAGGNITVQVGPNPETIDPAMNSAVDGANMILTAFETLLIIDENNTVQPGQAESYTVSDDGLIWTFTMRDGLKWSDGTDLTAEDFEYSFKRCADPAVAAPYGDTVMGMVKGFDEAMAGNVDALAVEAVDAKTLKIELSYPCAYFDKMAAFATLSPVQKATIDANGDAWATEAATYVSNGPFMITEWTPGERIVMTKNPHYVGGWDSSRIVSETITFLLIEDSSAAYAAYQTGEAQMIKDVPTEEIPSLTKVEDGGEFYVDPIIGTYYLSINNSLDVFKDINVRKALSLAIDRDYVANVIMQGTYSPAYNLNGTGLTEGSQDFMVKSKAVIGTDQTTNEAAAKQAMADAGYPEGKGFPTITYTTNDSGYHKAVAEYLQQQYKDVLGVNLEVKVAEWSAFSSQRRAGEYEMARNGWVCDYNDPANMIELFVTGNGNNDGAYSNPAYDEAFEASKVANVEERFAALHTAEDALMEDYGFIPVAYYNDFWLQSPSLQGSWHSAYGYWYFMYAYVAE